MSVFSRCYMPALFLATFACSSLLQFSSNTNAFAATRDETFVQDNIDKGYAILNAALSDEDRRAQFRDFITALIDVRRIGLFTIGSYAHGLSPADTDAFVDAFSDYEVAVYEDHLSDYKGQTIKVTGSSERTPDDVIVHAQVIAAAGGPPLDIDFRVRSSAAGSLTLTDLQVEGIWLALSERDDFIAFLQQNGGDVSKLAAHLHDLAGQLPSGTK